MDHASPLPANNMDLDIVDAKPCATAGHMSSVIGCEGRAGCVLSRCESNWSSVGRACAMQAKTSHVTPSEASGPSDETLKSVDK